MTKISFVFPARRPDKLMRALHSFFATTATYDVEIVVAADTPEVREIAQDCAHIVAWSDTPISAPLAWNLGASAATGDWIGLGADDLIFHDDWCEAIQPYLVPRWGMVGLNDDMDSYGRLGWATHWLASRDFLVKHIGGVLVPPVYQHGFVDVEVSFIAQALDLFVYVPDAHVEHLHPAWRKAESDALYDEKEAVSGYDRATFNFRRAANFPITWKPVIKPNSVDILQDT